MGQKGREAGRSTQRPAPRKAQHLPCFPVLLQGHGWDQTSEIQGVIDMRNGSMYIDAAFSPFSFKLRDPTRFLGSRSKFSVRKTVSMRYNIPCSCSCSYAFLGGLPRPITPVFSTDTRQDRMSDSWCCETVRRLALPS